MRHSAKPLVKRSKPKVERKTWHKERFRIIPFLNESGTESWRVTGTNRQGKQIRENFSDLKAAQCRQVELTTDWLGRQPEDNALRATTLTDTQLRIAEASFTRLDADDEMLIAVNHWLKHGRHHEVGNSLRLDEAVERFNAWLDGKPDENGNGICTLREHSRKGLRHHVGVFSNSVENSRVSDILPDTVETFLGKLKVSPTTQDNYRRAISRFFSWCIQRPRRWTLVNPCREIRVEKEEKQPPAILSVAQSKALLEASEPSGLAPYVAVCLFAGLRPFEAARLNWKAVNMTDREIRLEGNQTKTGKSRVIAICDTLFAWLTTHEDESFFPSNWRKKFDAVKLKAGFGTPDDNDDEMPKLTPWPVDVMRHTAISHYFRKTGSYGQTAEQFGNSEAIIKNHYQGRVSSADTKAFYALLPTKGTK
jgi:integrase